ncbi:hypothetical protein N184_27070 [Sinorhizobium sp. GL28]|nr:hypothetical protein N184_27070 [Sinorhizobium sp. GL28]
MPPIEQAPTFRFFTRSAFVAARALAPFEENLPAALTPGT